MEPSAYRHEYVPGKPLLALEDMPLAIRPHARRQLFAGTGAQYAPRVYGWVVFSHGGPRGGVAYDAGAKAWLKAQGFQHSGRRWLLRDDIACGENAFEQGDFRGILPALRNDDAPTDS